MRFQAPAGFSCTGLLGAGSLCVVARVRRDDEELACKRLLPHHQESAAARATLEREARSLAAARHPALPSLRAAGADEAGPYLLETIVEGVAIRALKGRWGGRVPRHLALHVASEAVRVTTEVQSLSDPTGPLELVHGDLSPDNVWLGPHGEVRLVDLGLSRHRDAPEEAPRGAGTAPYLAPELARGEASPSQETDRYALAATVAWLLLDGDAPLAAARGEAALLAEIGGAGIDPRRLAPLPTALREALASLLSPDRAARPADLEALAEALGRAPR